jgi:hypothetical protein
LRAEGHAEMSMPALIQGAAHHLHGPDHSGKPSVTLRLWGTYTLGNQQTYHLSMETTSFWRAPNDYNDNGRNRK